MIYIALVILFATLVIGVPVPMCFMSSAAWLLFFGGNAMQGYSTTMLLPYGFSQMNSIVLLAIALFIIAGGIMEKGRIGEKLIDVVDVFVGRIRGGLGVVKGTEIEIEARQGWPRGARRGDRGYSRAKLEIGRAGFRGRGACAFAFEHRHHREHLVEVAFGDLGHIAATAWLERDQPFGAARIGQVQVENHRIGHALTANLFLRRGKAACRAHILQPEADLERQCKRVAHQRMVVHDQDFTDTIG